MQILSCQCHHHHHQNPSTVHSGSCWQGAILLVEISRNAGDADRISPNNHAYRRSVFFPLSLKDHLRSCLSQMDLQCQLKYQPIHSLLHIKTRWISLVGKRRQQKRGGGKAHWQRDGNGMVVLLGAIEFTGIWSSVFVAARAPLALPVSPDWRRSSSPTCMGLALVSDVSSQEFS